MNALTRRDFVRVGATLTAAGLLRIDAFGTSPNFESAFARLDDYIARHMSELALPGLTLAIAERDRVLRVKTYGLADIKTKEALRPDHLFQIGSISKSFAAIALLQMREEGQLDLNRPVREYLPSLEIESKYAPITTHHLLSHTSGLPRDAQVFPRTGPEKLWTAYAPGKRYRYSNTAYQIAGLLMEAIDRRPLAEIIRSRVFARVGMENSDAVITPTTYTRSAVGYEPFFDDRPFIPGERMREAPHILSSNMAGCIASTPADMGAYLRMLLNRGSSPRGRVLSNESFNLLIRRAADASDWGTGVGYAYGFAVSDSDQRTIIRHTGGMVAFSSAVHIDLTSGFGVFASVNANLNGYRPNSVCRYALELLRAAANGQPLPELPAPDSPERVEKSEEYSGKYINPEGRSFEFTAEPEKLLLRDGKNVIPMHRLFGAPDRFAVRPPDLGLHAFKFNRKDGKITDLFHGSDWYISDRYSGPRKFDYSKRLESYVGHYRNEDPWLGSAQVYLRKGKLWIGDTVPLEEVGETAEKGSYFRPADEENSPERIKFDGVVNGQALRMNFSGDDYYRVETA